MSDPIFAGNRDVIGNRVFFNFFVSGPESKSADDCE